MKIQHQDQLNGYDTVIKEIDIERTYGKDYLSQKGAVQEYLNFLHPKRLRLRINKIITETPSTKTFRLVSEDKYLPPFQAGQYISLFAEVGHIKTSRPYSISSPPNQAGYLDITVRKVEDGLVSNWLLNKSKKGDLLESTGPTGNFYYNPIIHDKTMVCIAGGSGITPFMSIIREITDRGLDRQVFLFYGNKSLNDVIFHEELTALSKEFDNINYIPVIEEPKDDYKGLTGYITSDLLKKVIQEKKDVSYFLCGPEAMYNFCVSELEMLNIPKRKIRHEMYGPPIDICDYPDWPEHLQGNSMFKIDIKGRGQINVCASDSLLVSLEKNNIIVPSVCRGGECSMCRIKILSGKIFQPPGVPVRASDRMFGYVHSCVSYPLEDLEILLHQ